MEFSVHGLIEHCFKYPNDMKGRTFHGISSSALESDLPSVKEEFVLLSLAMKSETLHKLLVICQERCAHLLSATFLEGSVTVFFRGATTQLRFRALPRVILWDMVKVH